jgi:hypothetical protein
MVVGVALVVLAPWSSSGASPPVRQTLVFDAAGENAYVDKPPAGPSPGDSENIRGQLRDAAGVLVGTAHITCVFTKVIPNDVLEDCTARGRTDEGTLTLAGVGHLKSANPPWRVTGGTGAYKGVQGRLVFGTDIPVDPNVPLADGRLFFVAVFELTGNHHLRTGVVPRPVSNAGFIQRADAACNAAEATSGTVPGFPYTTFDPFHPDTHLLPQVGRYFDQPSVHRLPHQLLAQLEKLGSPPSSRAAWRQVLTARRAVLRTEATQIKVALAGDAPAFVRTVYQQPSAYNRLVFTSAVFGVQSCTFS